MAEYIEKAELIKKLCFETAEWYYSPTIKTIKAFPSTDVQPVKHGRWEYIRNVKLSGTIKLCECNQCHNKIFGGLSYCGNCGAKMDAEPDEPWQSE